MREKKPALIIAFASTADAMAAEQCCRDHDLPGRLIPLPREIHAGCGLAWKAPFGQEARFTAAFQEAGLRWETMGTVAMWG